MLAHLKIGLEGRSQTGQKGWMYPYIWSIGCSYGGFILGSIINHDSKFMPEASISIPGLVFASHGEGMQIWPLPDLGEIGRNWGWHLKLQQTSWRGNAISIQTSPWLSTLPPLQTTLCTCALFPGQISAWRAPWRREQGILHILYSFISEHQVLNSLIY